jgi:hypothetical protein
MGSTFVFHVKVEFMPILDEYLATLSLAMSLLKRRAVDCRDNYLQKCANHNDRVEDLKEPVNFACGWVHIHVKIPGGRWKTRDCLDVGRKSISATATISLIST